MVEVREQVTTVPADIQTLDALIIYAQRVHPDERPARLTATPEQMMRFSRDEKVFHHLRTRVRDGQTVMTVCGIEITDAIERVPPLVAAVRDAIAANLAGPLYDFNAASREALRDIVADAVIETMAKHFPSERALYLLSVAAIEGDRFDSLPNLHRRREEFLRTFTEILERDRRRSLR